MKETQFLAPILLESPLMFEILEKIRDKHNIDKLLPIQPDTVAILQDVPR